MSKKGRDHLSRDPVFAKIIEATTIERRRSDGDVYASLIRTIVYQQLSGKAAMTIHGRFLDLFSDGYPHSTQLIRLNATKLRSAGLSGQKSQYVQNVANFWQDEQLEGTDWNKLSDEQIIQMLTRIKGVGQWSAQMILMFTLNRPDVFPMDDLGIRNAIIKSYRLRSKGKSLEKRLLKIAEPWRPYRTLACRYLWRWYDAKSS